jgi:nitrate reductase assembly molybdenum cofactor insertion protein NarJ
LPAISIGESRDANDVNTITVRQTQFKPEKIKAHYTESFDVTFSHRIVHEFSSG